MGKVGGKIGERKNLYLPTYLLLCPGTADSRYMMMVNPVNPSSSSLTNGAVKRSHEESLNNHQEIKPVLPVSHVYLIQFI